MNIAMPASLRQLTQGRAAVQTAGGTIRELVADLERQYPGLRARLCDEGGNLRKFIAIFVNGRDIRTLQGDDTPLGGSEEIVIVVAVAGG
ncbi:MAG: MoaD/ThiS family protein [Kiritimatiellaeota bacterium]|nr:MoaD/ThiS family protein [Kiritimatiellota bacterium]